MTDALADGYDVKVGATRVRRLMREAGLYGVPSTKRRRRPVVGGDDVPDLLRRDFAAEQPNRVWVSDITEIKTAEGKLFLCMIKDVYDGVVVAYAIGARQTSTARFCIRTMAPSTRAMPIASAWKVTACK